MTDVALADAKARLSDLVERAVNGEAVRITRRGKAVARITGIERSPQPIDAAALRALTEAMPLQHEPARIWLPAMRDDARH